VRLDAGNFTRIEPAQAPPYQHERLVVPAHVDSAPQPVERIRACTPVHPLSPRMNAKSRFGECTPQLRRRPIIGGKSWNHQRGNAVMRTARAPVAESSPEAAG
jgi:hypothetical protein